MQVGDSVGAYGSAGDLMVRGPATTTAAEGTERARARMLELHVGALPVVDGARCVGIVTERDLLHIISPLNDLNKRAPIGAIMTANPRVVYPDTPLDEVRAILVEFGFRHIPVVDREHTLVGVLSARDVLRAIVSGSLRAADGCARDKMVDPLVFTEPPTSLAFVAHAMLEKHRNEALHVQSGVCRGLITVRDVLQLGAGHCEAPELADMAMAALFEGTSPPDSVTPEARFSVMREHMLARGYRTLPVCNDQGTPVGLVTVVHLLAG